MHCTAPRLKPAFYRHMPTISPNFTVCRQRSHKSEAHLCEVGDRDGLMVKQSEVMVYDHKADVAGAHNNASRREHRNEWLSIYV